MFVFIGFLNGCHALIYGHFIVCLDCVISWSVCPYACASVCFVSFFLRVNVKPRYISWLPDCQTESVGGDIHRGAFSGTFMRDFFPWLKGG